MLGLLAHALSLLVLGLGLVGVVALLLPRLSQVRTAHPGSHRPASTRSATLVSRPAAAGRDASPWRAVAATSSLAAATVHAEVFPHHLEENLPAGGFFLVVAALQATWAYRASRRVARGTLVAGIAGSLALIALWAASRTTGLPWGLTAGREAVGAWDLAAVGWQVCLVLACVRGLRHGTPGSDLSLGHLTTWTWAWIALSVGVLTMLSLTVTTA